MQAHAAALGTATNTKLEAQRCEEYNGFNSLVNKLRAGCAEEVESKVQSQVATQLAPSKNFAGTGSTKLRKQSVTSQLGRMRLRTAATAPHERLEKVLQSLSAVNDGAIDMARTTFAECFDILWVDQYEEKAAGHCASKAVLQRIVRAELPALAPMRVLTMIEKELITDNVSSTDAVDGIIVTTPIPDGRVKLGAQVVQLLVQHGFVGPDKWKNVIHSGQLRTYVRTCSNL